MKVLSKVALFTALVVFSACSVAETPFKVYADKDKSFKQIEKFLAGKSTKWENKQTQSSTDTAGTAYNYDAYARVYTYDNENYAEASFSYDKTAEDAQSGYQTYTHKKIALDGYAITVNGGGTAPSTDGYTLYELTQGPSGSATTSSPRAASKRYRLIKIDGSKLYVFDSIDSVDTAAKTIQFYSGSSTPVPTVYDKLK